MRGACTPQRLFVLIALPFGLCFALISFPFHTPDEANHFFRAYHVSEGRVLAENVGEQAGDRLPLSLVRTAELHGAYRYEPKRLNILIGLLEDHMLGLDPMVRAFIPFNNTALYCPVPYTPQATGILVGRLADLPPLILVYLGRLFNLMVWGTLMYWAIRVSPIHKWTITATALLPMQLHQAGSLSGDATIIGLCFLFSAVVLRYAFDARQGTGIKWSDMVLMCLLSVSVTLCKGVYIPLSLLVLLIPRRYFGSTKRYVLFLAGGFLLNVGALIGWSLAARGLFVQMNPFAVTDPAGQVAFVIHHPMAYLLVLQETVVRVGDGLAAGFIGLLGWTDIRFPIWVYIAHGLWLLGVATCDDSPSIRLTLWHRMVVVGVLVITTLLIFTGLYIQWNSVAHPWIVGLQGRYFLPLAIPLFLIVYNRYHIRACTGERFALVVGTGAVVSLSAALFVMTMAYYVNADYLAF